MTSNEETEMPTAAPPVMHENVLDDEVIVIPDDPPELHSAEPTAGNATTPPVAGTSDQVRERAGPVDIHLLSGVPDFFDRNKILSGGDLSHYQVPHCIRLFFYFVWFVFIRHNFQFYFELCTYCNILDIYLS